MRITADNWSDFEREIKESGVEEAIYDKRGYLTTVVSKSGIRYEMPVELYAQLVDSGAVKFDLGRKASKESPVG